MRLLIPFILLSLLLGLSVLWDKPEPEADLTTTNTVAVRSIDPQRMSWSHDIRLGYALFEGLCTYDAQTMALQPGVAERWQVSPDGRRYTFHLRPEARWSNGDPVTTSDFLYAWSQALLPENVASYTAFVLHMHGAQDFFDWASQSLQAVQEQADPAQRLAAAQTRRAQIPEQFQRLVGVSSPDPQTLIVELEKPTPYFLDLVAFPVFFPLHRSTLEEATALDPATGTLQRDPGWTKAGQLIGNGPYFLERWRFKRDLLLAASPYYWNAANVDLQTVRILNIEDINTAFVAYQTGALDLLLDGTPLPYAPDLVEQAIHGEREDIHTSTWFGTYFYNFNCRERLADGSPNPFHDPRVRRAFTMAIDKARIVDHVTRLHQQTASTIVPPGAFDDYPSPGGVDHDPAAAKALLAEAGYPGGQGFPPVEILYNTGGGHEKIAQVVANTWRTVLGVPVSVRGMEVKVLADRMNHQDYMVARASWIGDYGDPTTFLDLFLAGGSNNRTGYADPTFDKLMADAADTLDPQRRMDLLAKAEARLTHDTLPIAPIYHYRNVYLFDADKLEGISFHPRALQLFHQMRRVP